MVMNLIKMSKTHPAEMFLVLWRHYDLILQLVKRDILMKYRGSYGGVFWVLLSPILMLGIYTVVFGVFMQVRWPGVDDTLIYSIIIYTGLIVLNFFSECINRSSSIIVGNPNFVKKIIFPLEIYPWVIVGTALFQALINMGILALFSLMLLGKIHFTIFLVPLIFIPLILVTLGMSWLLCSLGVFIRDITHAMVFIMQIVMYLSPIFYSITTVPHNFQFVLFANPLTYIIEQTRRIAIFGQSPQWLGLGFYFSISIFVAWFGFVWFQKTKDGFADVL